MKSNNYIGIIVIIIIMLAAALACNLPLTSPTSDLAGMVAQTQTASAINQLVATTSSVPQVSTPVTTQSPPQMI